LLRENVFFPPPPLVWAVPMEAGPGAEGPAMALANSVLCSPQQESRPRAEFKLSFASDSWHNNLWRRVPLNWHAAASFCITGWRAAARTIFLGDAELNGSGLRHRLLYSHSQPELSASPGMLRPAAVIFTISGHCLFDWPLSRYIQIAY
jgi:hypothetical protein